MCEHKDCLIIIPMYNEIRKIEEVLESLEMPEISSFADILVMNDASNDGCNFVVKNRHHALVTHVYNLGYGSGLQLGYKYAVRNGYKYVIQMDADGQHAVSNVPKIYEALTTRDEDGHTPDIILGSRFLEGSETFYIPVTKRIAFTLFRAIIKLTTGRKILDPTTGLQGLNKDAVIYYAGYTHFDDKYPDANMLLQMSLLGFEIKEIPAVMVARETGKSMHSGIIKPILYMIRMMISLLATWARIKIFKLYN